VVPVATEPGHQAQVDFGSIGRRYDPIEGRMRQAWVFVMVLSHSRASFVRIVFDQKVKTWLRLHIEAFEHFGGVPVVVVPDNLKAAVVRAAFGVDAETALHRSYRELARHYGFVIDPTPPYSPQKKGKVESAVKYVKNNFAKARPGLDAQALQAELVVWHREVAQKRVHGTTGRTPLELFEAESARRSCRFPTSATYRPFSSGPRCTATAASSLSAAPTRCRGRSSVSRCFCG
jgi:transposase